MTTLLSPALSEKTLGQSHTLFGWVHRIRNHGGVLFIDLRRGDSMMQITIDPKNQPACFAIAEQLRNEYVIEVSGTLQMRPKASINSQLSSGEFELIAETIQCLNKAKSLPFNINDNAHVSEEVRLQYRYLDLRRQTMRKAMQQRALLIRHLRLFLEQQEFTDIETPILTKSTPEGARDYLVPSRTHPKHFFALPQSPQQFKQLLMVAGFERYYQVVRCFRDEDLRTDRQPEFTQLDIEMAFINEQDIQQLMEQMICSVFHSVLGVSLPQPFPKISYNQAIELYGTDRPDLRAPLQLIDVAPFFKEATLDVLAHAACSPEHRIAALCLKQGAQKVSRKGLEQLTAYVQNRGAKGLAYIKVKERADNTSTIQSPIGKFLADDAIEKLLDHCQAQAGDLILIQADLHDTVNDSMSHLRIKLCQDHGLMNLEWAPLWVIDFPMFEEKKQDNRFQSMHHPFTSPVEQDPELLRAQPEHALSRAYDMVLNGHEIGGGSIRIHKHAMQQTVFELLGLPQETIDRDFKHLIEALQYGAPPHGGMAFGIDRLAMLMSQADSIREVIAFPKTQSVYCPLTQAPSQVSPEQLKELGIANI